MAKVDQPIRIKPVAYNNFSEPDSTIVTAESFNCNAPFLIVASQPIPKSSKVYFEVTLTKQISSKHIRHLPIYLGIHKNPVSGILGTDCIFASCYYTLAEDFDIFEKHAGSAVLQKQTVGKLHARIPIVNTVIGFGVDTFENKLSLYSNGQLFYEFTAQTFDLDNSASDANGLWYFAIYNKLVQSIAGKINYGRYRTEYLPEGYSTLYKEYWYHDMADYDIDSSIDVNAPIVLSKMANFDGKIETVNNYTEIHPLDHIRRPYLEHKGTYMDYENNDLMFQMMAYRGSYAPDITTVNLPCPAEDTPIYFEVTIRNGKMVVDKESGTLKYIGVPIEVGLTVKKNDYTQKSFRVCLYHIKGGTYLSYSVYDSNQSYQLFPPITNPSSPVQPATIGFIFDRKNNLITIITNGSVFAEVPIQGADFSDWQEDAYIFIKSADQAYEETLIGRVELGEHAISYDLPDGVKTVYEYWNDSIRFYLEDNAPWFSCRMKVRIPNFDVRYDMMSSLFVPYTKENTNGFEPGLNYMWGTYNVVTDTEPENNLPSMPIYTYWSQMQEDLQNNSIKKLTNLDIDSMIEVENDHYIYLPILTGDVTLTKPAWYELDCRMKVIEPHSIKKNLTVLLHGTLHFVRHRYLDAFLLGFVALDSDNTEGYPNWVVVNQCTTNKIVDGNWNKRNISWDIEGLDTKYVRDTTTNPRFDFIVKPIPAIDYTKQKANIEVFYNGVSIGTEYFDATGTDNTRQFLSKTYEIPTLDYDPSTGNKISVTITNDPGCTFKGIYLMAQIVIKATSEI